MAESLLKLSEEYTPDKDFVWGLDRSSPYGKSKAKMLGERLPSLVLDNLEQLGLDLNEELKIIDDLSDRLDERRLHILDGPGDSEVMPPPNGVETGGSG